METQRFFEVSMTENWIEKIMDYEHGKSHNDVAFKLPLPCKRVYNERYNEIERTGKYYRITEAKKGGKGMIFEILN